LLEFDSKKLNAIIYISRILTEYSDEKYWAFIGGVSRGISAGNDKFKDIDIAISADEFYKLRLFLKSNSSVSINKIVSCRGQCSGIEPLKKVGITLVKRAANQRALFLSYQGIEIELFETDVSLMPNIQKIQFARTDVLVSVCVE
jgi:hypothetical protein